MERSAGFLNSRDNLRFTVGSVVSNIIVLNAHEYSTISDDAPISSRQEISGRQTISERNAIPVLDVSVLDELSRRVKPVRQAIPVLSRRAMLLRQTIRKI